MKHSISFKIKRVLFYILSWTWGIIPTLPGTIAILMASLITHKPIKKFGWGYYVNVGKNWGGLELGGGGFMTDDSNDYGVKCHELGHSISQAVFLGPLFIFVCWLPSITRYWLREMGTQEKMKIFAGICVGTLTILGASGLTLGIVSNALWAMIMCGLILIYAIIMGVWLFGFEILKYQEQWPKYDAIWFEELATKSGTDFMKKYYPEER